MEALSKIRAMAQVVHEFDQVTCETLLGFPEEPLFHEREYPMGHHGFAYRTTHFGVLLIHCDGSKSSAEEIHKTWVDGMMYSGWGPGEYCPSKKTDPRCVPWDDLEGDYLLSRVMYKSTITCCHRLVQHVYRQEPAIQEEKEQRLLEILKEAFERVIIRKGDREGAQDASPRH